MPSGCHSAVAFRRHIPSDLLLQEVTSGKSKYDYLQGGGGGEVVLPAVSGTGEARPQHSGIGWAKCGSQSECFGGVRVAARAHIAERLIQPPDRTESPSSKSCYVSGCSRRPHQG